MLDSLWYTYVNCVQVLVLQIKKLTPRIKAKLTLKTLNGNHLIILIRCFLMEEIRTVMMMGMDTLKNILQQEYICTQESKANQKDTHHHHFSFDLSRGARANHQRRYSRVLDSIFEHNGAVARNSPHTRRGT